MNYDQNIIFVTPFDVFFVFENFMFYSGLVKVNIQLKVELKIS